MLKNSRKCYFFIDFYCILWYNYIHRDRGEEND